MSPAVRMRTASLFRAVFVSLILDEEVWAILIKACAGGDGRRERLHPALPVLCSRNLRSSTAGLLELCDRCLDERGDVARLPARDQVAVDDDLPVDVLRTRISDILRDRSPAGDPPAAEHLRRDQELRRVAYQENRFTTLDELPYELDGRVVGPEFVGRVAAGYEKCVEVIR